MNASAETRRQIRPDVEPRRTPRAQPFIRIHRLLALVGGLALLLWGSSGLLHVTMTTFGPQPARFFPPSRTFDPGALPTIAGILAAAGIERAAAVKVIASDGESLIQITETQDAPRRYLRLRDGAELPDHDPRHAEYLARHYTGLLDTPILATDRIAEFDTTYPAVSRLLPVYRVVFDRPDRLTAYVYTETSSLALLTDRRQAFLLRTFQTLHSWNWLAGAGETLRIATITLFLGSLIAMALTGLAMLVAIRRRSAARGLRGWHRAAAYVLWLPILTFAGSGLFHLYQNGWQTRERTLTLSPPLELGSLSADLRDHMDHLAAHRPAASLSLIQDGDRRWLYRMTLAADPAEEPRGDAYMRHARFEGRPRAGEAFYVDAHTGEVRQDWDREYALQLGERFTGKGRDAIRRAELVTRFGPHYDFRNKRLPVWRLDYGAPVHASIFVDTAAGVLADRTPDRAKAELLTFSYLHKWTFRHGFGPMVPSLAIAATVLACLVAIGILGILLDLRRRRRSVATGRRGPSPRRE